MEKAGNKGFVYEFGKFALDSEGKTLFSGGKPIHLPAKGFETPMNIGSFSVYTRMKPAARSSEPNL
jgi:hypothetical protein